MNSNLTLEDAYALAKEIANSAGFMRQGVAGGGSASSHYDMYPFTQENVYDTHMNDKNLKGKFISFKLKLTKSNSYNIKRNQNGKKVH
jgi:hypothetical protein